MSDMSQAQSQTGGDPLDLVNAAGTEDDVMPGPANIDADDSGEDAGDGVSGRAMDMGNEDPAPEGGASLDPPGAQPPDPASGVDPLHETEASNVQVPGEAGGDLESGADPMPDMSGTTPS
ncbi:MAG TPA: hypothetical protein VE476_10330 [Propionibacteriaceae bacterium]|jgi:hypothetical protein|nr:hypothetical protein [Propionibacteriaceae bacterium]